MVREDLLEEEKNNEIESITKYIEDIKKFCAIDEDIAEFVEHVLSDGSVSNILRSVMYDLGYAEVSIRSLRSFIANYFLDDSEFVVLDRGSALYVWGEESVYSSQSVRKLIDIAKRRAEIYEKLGSSGDRRSLAELDKAVIYRHYLVKDTKETLVSIRTSIGDSEELINKVINNYGVPNSMKYNEHRVIEELSEDEYIKKSKEF